MATKKYNPYNDVKSIVDLKGKYADAKSLGQDPTEYQTAAAKYYNSLHENGYDDAADILTLSDYRKASEYLNNGSFKPDDEFEFDNWYDSIGKISTGEQSPSGEKYSNYLDDLMGVGTGKTAPQASDSVTKLMEQWFADNSNREGVRQKGSDYLDYLKDFDYTQQSYYQPIMDTYNLYGDNAANGELASGSASNGGNIDSYSAANAARQQLAFTNAGHQAALAAAKQNQDAWQNVYGMTLDDYTNAENALLSQIGNLYSTDAAERASANDVIASLFGTESAERQNATNAITNKYLADLGLEETKYTTDSNERMNTANNENAITLQKLANEANTTVASIEAAAEKYGYDKNVEVANANNQTALEQLQKQIAADRNMQYWENQYQIAQDNRDLENEIALEEAKYDIANKQAEADDYSDPDFIARNVVDMIKDGELDSITTWDEFGAYLTSNGVSSSNAVTQMDKWKKLYPALLKDNSSKSNSNSSIDLNAILGTPKSKYAD